MESDRNLCFSSSSVAFILLLLIPHCKPDYFNYVPFFDMLFNILRIGSALVVFGLYFFHIFREKRLYRNKIQIVAILLLYYVELILSTVLNQANIYVIVLRVVSQLSVFLICSYYASYARTNLISALFHMGEIMVYTNLFTILRFPKGLYISEVGYWRNWLLGYKNLFLPYFIGFYIAAYLYQYTYKGFLRSKLLVISMLLSLLLVGSSTSIIVFSLFSLLAFFIKFDHEKIINALVLTIINIISYLLIVKFRIANLLSFIIVRLFHKDTTFGGRTQLWDFLYEFIRNKFLWGNGCLSGPEMALRTNTWWAFHAHNLVVQLLYEGGIISLLLYALFNYMLLRDLYRNRFAYVAQIITIGLFVLNIAFITEVYINAMIFVVYGVASAVNDLVELEYCPFDNKLSIRLIWRNRTGSNNESINT